MKIATVIGARPQFIKASIFSHHLKNYKSIEEIIIHTGQHFDDKMSNIFFNEMNIPSPHYNLGVNSLSHGAMTGRQLEEVEKVLLDEKPDFLLVYGDTNSTLAGALAAVKLNIPIIHIESGLRSFNRNMPEEINRILTDHIAQFLFVPTKLAEKNLINEGINSDKIYNVGDIMYDAALFFGELAKEKSQILNTLNIEPRQYILATIHRSENTNNIDKLKNIINALSSSFYPVILPLHPRTAKILQEHKIQLNSNINKIDPVGYLDMLMLEKNALKIVTDSGGVQKEAYFHQVPCITLRDETEWMETVSKKCNILTGSSIDKIQKAIAEFSIINKENDNIYGNGDCAQKIINIITK